MAVLRRPTRWVTSGIRMSLSGTEFSLSLNLAGRGFVLPVNQACSPIARLFVRSGGQNGADSELIRRGWQSILFLMRRVGSLQNRLRPLVYARIYEQIGGACVHDCHAKARQDFVAQRGGHFALAVRAFSGLQQGAWALEHAPTARAGVVIDEDAFGAGGRNH